MLGADRSHRHRTRARREGRVARRARGVRRADPAVVRASGHLTRVRRCRPPAVDAELRDAVRDARARTARGVAVRSSARRRGRREHSFAGQLDSFLFVSARRRRRARRGRVGAPRSATACIAYRREHGLTGPRRGPAVLVQRMVDADAAGVAFAADPVTGRRGVAVVAARMAGHRARLRRRRRRHLPRVARRRDRRAPHRRQERSRTAQRADGTRRSRGARRAGHASPRISDEQVARGRRAGASGRAALRAAAGHRVGDRGGQALPAPVAADHVAARARRPRRRAQPLGQQQHRRELQRHHDAADVLLRPRRLRGGVPPVLPDHRRARAAHRRATSDVFRHMLGLVRGRVYYNLLNWYRLLALLPGFTANRAVHGADDGREGGAARRARGEARAGRPGATRLARRLRLAAHASSGWSATTSRCRARSRASTSGSSARSAPARPAAGSCGRTSWSRTTATSSGSCSRAGTRRWSTTSSR